jgi:hypothetical protein
MWANTSRPKETLGAAREAFTGAESSIPEAAIVSVIPARETRLVVVRCPFCGGRHIHGWPLDETSSVGLRRSHCGAGDYCVAVVSA